MSRILSQPLLHYNDANGRPLPGAKCFTYLSQTNTPAVVYQDGLLTIPHENPVIALTNGYFPAIYGQAGVELKLILTDRDGGNPLPPIDPASPFVLTAAEIGASLYPQTDAEQSASLTPTDYTFPSGNVMRFGADPTGGEDSWLAFTNTYLTSHHVYIPTGTYKLNSNITAVRSGTKTTGDGFQSILLRGGNNQRVFSLNNVTDLVFQDFMIDGDKPSVGWETTSNFDIGFGIGETSATTQCARIAIRGVYLKDLGLDGAIVRNARFVSFVDCFFENCRRWGIVPNRQSVDAFGVQHLSVKNCFFDCTNGSGPVGKEYPLGAVDAEPDGEDQYIDYIEFDGIHSNAGAVSLHGGAVRYSSVSDIFIQHDASIGANPAYLALTNGIKIAGKVVLKGQAHLLIDSGADSVTTQAFLEGSIHFIEPIYTGGTAKTIYNKGESYWPVDWMDEFENNTASSSSNVTKTRVTAEIDGHSLLVDQLSFTSAATGSYTIKQQIPDNLVTGDQVVVMLEIERTDTGSPNANYLLIDVANDITRIMQPPAGISRVMVAQRVSANLTAPTISIGFSGTPSQIPTVIFRKCFVYVNPTTLNERMFRIQGNQHAPDSYTGTLTGGTTSPTATIETSEVGDQVTLEMPALTATSAATSQPTITGMPARLHPVALQTVVGISSDNSAGVISRWEIGTNGTITLFNGVSSAFTASGAKGANACTVTYRRR
jgi:hypothetical protein